MATKMIGMVDKTVLKKMYEETQIVWRIPDITIIAEAKDTDTYYKSRFFFINGISTCFQIYPKSTLNKGFIRLFLKLNVNEEFSPEYKICLKRLDGSLEHLVSGIVTKEDEDQEWYDMGNIIKRSELLQRKSEFVSHDGLTIICRFLCEVIDSTDPTGETIPLKLIRLDKLSDNFKDLFSDEKTCDVTLKVKNKEYKAHRSVLMARSSVFAANFKHDTLEKQTGVITIPDCDPDSFPIFLEYLYSGKLSEISYISALNLYYISNKYDVEELKVFCIEYLMQCLTVGNVCEIAVFADQYDETQLSKAVQEFFNENSLEIFLISEWDHLLKNNNCLVKKLLSQMSKMKLKK